MAKYGEGDKRWIVEERPDGANVHNWHWAETNCLEYSKNLLTKLLTDLQILNGEGNLFLKIKTVDKVDGEAYVNVRKGKIIPGYEISVVLSWEGVAKDGEGKELMKVEGNVEFPYIADENADEDPEMKITVRDDGVVGKRLKDAFYAKGRAVVLEKIRVYVESMAKGGPCKEELEVKKTAAAAKSVSSSSSSAAAATTPPPPAAVAVVGSSVPEKKKKEKEKEGFKTIAMTEKFNCKAQHLFEILMDENRWRGFTQSNAKISKEVGGEFTIFDGSVTGIHQELQEGKSIVQKWRFQSWADGIYSTVTISFDEPESGYTVVKLKQTGVPEEDRYGNSTVVENTERGWRDLIFNKIRAVFGFGI